MMQKDIILIADYGRSGQGWLSYMICYILNARYIEPYCLLRGIVFSGHDKIVELTQGNLPARAKTRYNLVVKTHNLPDYYFSLTDKVILLARDPRDVAVSALARYTVAFKTGTDVEVGAQKKMDGLKLGKSIFRRFIEWLKTVKLVCYFFTAYRWKKFYESWDGLSLSHRLTYEELSSNPKATLQRLLKYLEIEASDELIDEAIGEFTFKKLTGREKGSEQKGNVAFRKGIVGDYCNHFSKVQLYLFKAICGKIMSLWRYK